MAYLQLNFESQCLQGNTAISVILPDKTRGLTPREFYSQEKRYKVLWLLHGTFGAVSYTHLDVYKRQDSTLSSYTPFSFSPME